MLQLVKSSVPSLMDDFFGNDFFDNIIGLSKAKSDVPTVNVIEENDSYRLEMAAPGFDKEQLKIDLHNDVLTISAEKKEENEEKNKKFLRREFGYCSFKRSFILPDTVDAEKIKAEHNKGILTVTIPKKELPKEKEPYAIKIE
jgi:HSP20 family protein